MSINNPSFKQISAQGRWLFSIILLLVLASSGCGKTRLGSMTIDEAFEDPAAARLVEAALDGQAQEIQTLVKQGVDVNYEGKDDITPLLWAIGSRSPTGMKLLLSVGADLNHKATRGQMSAINLAAGADDPEFLKILLEHGGGDLNSTNVDRESPLRIAVQQNRPENVKMLIKYGADINLSGGIVDITAAESAVSLARYNIAVYMLEQGYHHDLQGLAALAESGQIDPDSDQQKWKLKLLKMLKQRGVKFPAFVPKKKKRKYPSVHDRN